MRFRCIAGLLWLVSLLPAQSPRLCGDLLLIFDANRAQLRVIPLTPGVPARAVSFARAPEPFQSILVWDYVITAKGRLAVSALGVRGGQADNSNLILVLDLADLAKPAAVIPTGPVACPVLEAGRGGVWCLGPVQPALMRGDDYPVLHCFGCENDPADDPGGGILKRSQLPRENVRSPWAAGARLMAANGGLVAWMPGVQRIARVSESGTRITELFTELPSQSTVSVALDERARLHAVLPLRRPETLSTPYGLFRLDGQRWVRVAPEREIPRAARLLAIRAGKAALIDRQLRLTEIPLESGPTTGP